MSKALAPLLGPVPDLPGGNLRPDEVAGPAAGSLKEAPGAQGAEAYGAERTGVQFDAFRLDTVNEYLWHGEVPVELAPKAFAVLRYLVEHPGRLVTHHELLEAIWPETYVQPEILKTYIRNIRKTLADDPRAPRFIQTRARRGYHFIAPVSHEAIPRPAVRGHSPVAGSGGATTTQVLAGPRLQDPIAAHSPRLVQLPAGRSGRPARHADGVGNGPMRFHRTRALPKGRP
jgi:DNA-binding winged helix-turn-helix (wHTH) protein